jgi:hypothetical protein
MEKFFRQWKNYDFHQKNFIFGGKISILAKIMD